MVLKKLLDSIIQLYFDELALLKEEEINITLLQQHEKNRFQKIKELFESFHETELVTQSDLLNEIKVLDQQLSANMLEQKRIITKELSEFRNNNKASKAYKNI